MSSSTAKRLILYRFDRQPVEALIHSDGYLLADGVELMTRDGNVQTIDYKDIKALCFGAEGGPADLFEGPATFARRPKTAGLWISFRLRDGDILEGVLPHNLLEWPIQGYLFIPPLTNTYRQRVFVPRAAIQETALLGTVGKASPHVAKAAKKSAPVERQLSMFD